MDWILVLVAEAHAVMKLLTAAEQVRYRPPARILDCAGSDSLKWSHVTQHMPQQSFDHLQAPHHCIRAHVKIWCSLSSQPE